MQTNMVGKLHRYLKNHASTILAILGSTGVVMTAYAASKNAVKAQKHIKAAESEKGEELTLLEKVDVAAMDYIPTALSSVASIACIMGSDHISRKKQTAMIGAYAMLDKFHTAYKNKVQELSPELDEEAQEHALRVQHKFLPPELGDKHLFYEEHYGNYFESTMDAVRQAEYEVNRQLCINGEVSINSFMHYLNLPDIPGGNDLGWTIRYLDWVDFDNNIVTIDDDLECCCIESHIPLSYL